MPGSVIPVTGLILGPVGSISQTDFPLVSPRLVNSTDTISPNFGDPCVLNANNTYSNVAQFIANGGTLTGTTPLGVAKETTLVNPYYPNAGGQSMPAGTYAPGTELNLLTRGTINVAINNGTPTGAGQPVYVRVSANGALNIIGGFEAIADGAHTVQIPNLVFKTGILSTDPATGQVTAQLTILNRLVP